MRCRKGLPRLTSGRVSAGDSFASPIRLVYSGLLVAENVWRSIILHPPSNHAGSHLAACVPPAFQLTPVAWQDPTRVYDGLAWPMIYCHVADEIPLRIFLSLLLMLWEVNLLSISSSFDLARGLIRRSPSSVFALHGGKVVVVAFRGCATSSLALQHRGGVAFPPSLGFWAYQLHLPFGSVVAASYRLPFAGPKVIKASSTAAEGHSW